ncbi:MAG: type II toxin-antitoxin system prevent-host-death family antitoxin [Acidobacteriota bacterium]
MANTYSTYEAKARFSEILRKVRAGQHVWVTYHGRRVAVIRPLEVAEESFADRLRRLESEGVLIRAASPGAGLPSLARQPGALKRFLEQRE